MIWINWGYNLTELYLHLWFRIYYQVCQYLILYLFFRISDPNKEIEQGLDLDVEAEMRLKLIENARLKTSSKTGSSKSKTTSAAPRDKIGGKHTYANARDKRRSESKESKSYNRSKVTKSDNKDSEKVSEVKQYGKNPSTKSSVSGKQ